MKMVMITMIGIPRSYVFMYVLMHKYSYKKEMNCEFGTNQEYMRILLMTMMMLMITYFSRNPSSLFSLYKCIFFSLTDRSYVLGNAQSPDCAIIYCSDNFCRLSGYSRAEVMQKAALCTFLHGPLTSQAAIRNIQASLVAEEERQMETLLYKKDGKENKEYMK